MSAAVEFFVDTSVLIAAYDTSRSEYAESHKLLLSATQTSCACGAHSIAEFYSVLSRLPGGRRQRPDFAGALVDDVSSRMAMIALTAAEYMETLRDAARDGIAGGTVYDAILLRCARKVDAQWIYTWNVRHFQLVAPDLKERIRTP